MMYGKEVGGHPKSIPKIIIDSKLTSVKDFCLKLAGNRKRSLSLINTCKTIFERKFHGMNDLDIEKLLDWTTELQTFICSFENEEYFIDNWMSNDQSDDFMKFYIKLCDMFNVKFRSESFYTDLKQNYLEDNNALIEIIGNSLKEYSAIKSYETRELNSEMVEKINYLLRKCSLDVLEMGLPKLKTFNKTFLENLRDNILGSGARGIVYKGKLRGMSVAIKEIGCSRECWNEAMKLQLHQFPGVVRFFGVDDASHPTLIVMELAEQSLSDLLRSEVKMSLLEKLKLLTEIASTIAFLHSVKILHRDLKPSNILLMKDKKIKVADFEYAVSTALHYEPSNINPGTPRTLTTSTGSRVKGTFEYLAPKLLINENLILCTDYTEETDLYAFAIMMNEVLTEKHPYSGLGLIELINIMRVDNSFRPKVYVPENEMFFMPDYIQKWWSCSGSKEWDFTRVAITLQEMYNDLEESILSKPVFPLGKEYDIDNSYIHIDAPHIHIEAFIASLYWTGHYSGGMADGKMTGYGKLVCINGNVIEGYWSSDNNSPYPICQIADGTEVHYVTHSGIIPLHNRNISDEKYDKLFPVIELECHRHPMVKRRYRRYKCDICDARGYTVGYRCMKCHFDCHPWCIPNDFLIVDNDDKLH